MFAGGPEVGSADCRIMQIHFNLNSNSSMNDFFSIAAFANRYTSNQAQFSKACDADLMVRYPTNVNFVMYS